MLWFRRDLRLGDHAALLAAAQRSRDVLAVFVLDEALLKPSGPVRRTFLYRSLRALEEQLDGRLLVLRGDPAAELPKAAGQVGADSVHVSADTGPYGRERDERVANALADNGIELVRTGSPYAVTPGRVRKGDGTPFKVFTPFRRAWAEHGWRAPADTDASTVDWITAEGGVRVPADEDLGEISLPTAGERAAIEAWESFVDERVTDYADRRDRPAVDGTSRMSAYLRWGQLHPRTLLADLARHTGQGAETYRSELAWREFYADVLWHRPETARRNYDRRFDKIDHDTDDELFAAWCAGRTGFPIVDAGMRQLLAEGWMHNRVRMITASFLVKDLHQPWWRGARHFMRHLVDGDLASNQHGWQWTAGCGTDAAPYFRVFNPTTQGERFDPDGDYVRRYVPELRGLPGKRVHKPLGVPGYPEPIVDHKHEREVALARYGATRS
ncbi:deoxyribodipyrimidine photo-lyase [Crossiella sp. CA-258035]|uniref:cryptochrome/photolyase family protein n=1 Tax=Crossiella sp. CA-258035 TaxID=2981138 RepID=UPI0024BCD6CD|nr:deoxyribodipyrimidine photo-lyase [Crossiella sp. CA-258035]WHT23454.1 deoxyribodipyrimidine photo-lyase [Crossiella sp. CA-258035]